MNEGKAVLVTGAGHRIGACIARAFHQRGLRVLIHYNRSRAAALALAQELNLRRESSAAILRADLTSEVDVRRLGAEVLGIFGRLDVLVNNASSFYPTEFGRSTEEQWQDLIDSNLRGAFFLSQALSEELKEKGGSIINIIDTHANRPLAGFPIYSVAKAGLKAMTRSLAIELAPWVRVNGVSPGAILWPPSLEDDSDPEVLKKREETLQKIPLGHLGDPKDIAETVCFLASDASYVTGQVIKVDGGRSL